MKIVFLSDDFPPESFGGAGISTFELALGMKRAGHDVSAITTCRNKEAEGEAVYQGITVYRIASDYPAKWRWYVSLINPPVTRKVGRILEREKPDVVHINNVHFYLSYRCFKIAKRYAGAVVYTVRDVMPFNFAKLDTKRYLDQLDARTTWRDHVRQAKKRWNPFRNAVIRHYARYADKIFAISRSLEKALAQNGIPGAEVIYNGIDLRDWETDDRSVETFKRKHGLLGKKVLLFSGRLSASKGGEQAVEAVSRISRTLPDVVLLVAGAVDAYARSMEAQAEQSGIGSRTIFTGWMERDEMKTAYSAADVVLMPSLCLDTFGRVNIEAMAAKKPVVGTRFGGTPEIVEDGVTGYIVDPRDIGTFAAMIMELLADKAKAESFGLAGYERARTRFNLDNKVDEYVAWYEKLLDHAR